MGLKAGTEVEQKNSGGSAGAHWQIEFEEFRKAVEPYTLDFVAPLVKGDDDETLESFKARLVRLADLVCDRKRDLLSFWCMGFNQHQRGVWANELVYSIHLLMGKHAKPGNGAFSLTGQPSACGSAREVGTFCHRLPSDMLVANGEHRKKTEGIWNLPAGTLNPKVGYSVMEIMRGLRTAPSTSCGPRSSTSSSRRPTTPTGCAPPAIRRTSWSSPTSIRPTPPARPT